MKKLDSKAVWIFFMNSLVGVVIGALVFSGMIFSWAFDFGGDIDFSRYITGAVLIVVVFAALAFIWAKLTYHFYRYELTDLGFRKESGVIYKRYVTIPYSRIQNVDINRGILARLLGLSDLQIQTAGMSASISRHGAMGAGAEGRLPGVSKEDAELLRDDLIKRASRSNNQGL